jgi:NADH dehydrogenase
MSADLTSVSVDITDISTLRPAFQNAHTVISLVGILQGSIAKFEAVQWKGAENVAVAAQEAGAKLVHLSAIGADPNSPLTSPRTKGLGEQSVLRVSPAATIIRPSLVFGPGDSFFAVGGQMKDCRVY